MRSQNREPAGYLSLKALAGYSGLSVRTLRGYLTRAERPLPHFRAGSKILVRRQDFDAWMEQHRVRTDPSGMRAAVDEIVASLM